MRRTNVRYGCWNSVEFFKFYVVCVSRLRIGLGVIYVHVKSIDNCGVIWSMRTGILSRMAHAPLVKSVIYVGSH